MLLLWGKGAFPLASFEYFLDYHENYRYEIQYGSYQIDDVRSTVDLVAAFLLSLGLTQCLYLLS